MQKIYISSPNEEVCHVFQVAYYWQRSSCMQNKPLKYIIVGIDFSVYSKIVVKEARLLATEMNLPIKYVHIFDYFQTLGDTIQQFEENVRKKILKIYRLPSDADIVLRLGDPAQQLIDVARQASHSPLIIVGYRGHSKISHFFLGSTAEEVATASPFPVWIHRGMRTVLPKKVLVPSDFSNRTDTTLERIKAFEDKLNADVELYHVIPQAIPVLDYPGYTAVNKRLQEEDDRDYEAFKNRHPHLKTVRSQGNVIDKIQKRSKKFNLIALSPSEKSDIVPLLGRTATKLLRGSEKPVLICP